MMISMICFDLLPEALEEAGMPITVAGCALGVCLLLQFDRLFHHHGENHPDQLDDLHHHQHALTHSRQKNMMVLGMMMIGSVALHNFPEGMATFVGALNDPQMGAGITFAIAVHNIPEGIAVAIPIFYATRSKTRALLYATLSGLTEPVGAAICYGVTAVSGLQIQDGGAAFPLILSAVAGIMVYISLDELLPTAEKYGKHHVAIAGVVSGMAIMAVSLLLL